MNLKALTAEEIISKWEAHRAVQNLMGKITYHYLLKKEGQIFSDFWSSAEDVCLGMNKGYYVGKEAVSGYYAALHEETVLRSKLLCERFAEEVKDKTEEEKFGIGCMDYKPLSSDLIEIAEDGKTAKGMWLCQGSYEKLTAGGPLAYWEWSCFAVDFIREGDDWKIWHMLYFRDIDHPCGTSWTQPPQERPVIDCFAAMGDFKMPKPTVRTTLWERYHVNRPFKKLPRTPVPYRSFADTFSYGYEEGVSAHV